MSDNTMDKAHQKMHGLLAIYKPPGMVSKDVSRHITKHLQHPLAMGHIGTLDPMAEGVLPIALGKATKLQDYLLTSTKVYEVKLTFGYSTDSLDITGNPEQSSPLPVASESEVKEVLETFLGESMQIPPLYAAIKYRGKPLYHYARKGKSHIVPRESMKRCIKISNIHLHKAIYTTCNLQTPKLAAIYFSVACSKGTYIRVLCADIASKLSSLGVMSSLKRLETAGITAKKCIPLATLLESPHTLSNHIIAMRDIPLSLGKITVDEDEQRKLSYGQKLYFAKEALKTRKDIQDILEDFRYHRNTQNIDSKKVSTNSLEADTALTSFPVLVINYHGDILSLGQLSFDCTTSSSFATLRQKRTLL